MGLGCHAVRVQKGLNDYLANAGPGASVRTLDELIAYNEANSDIALKYGQGTLIFRIEQVEH